MTNQNARIEIRDIGARYSLTNGDVAVTGIHAQVLGGALGGTMTMHDLTGSTKSHLAASLKEVSLSELQSQLQERYRRHPRWQIKSRCTARWMRRPTQRGGKRRKI